MLKNYVRKDASRETIEAAVARAKESGAELVHVTPEMAVLSKADARDPGKYAEAKRCAEALGVSVSFAAADDDTSPLDSLPTYVATDRNLYVTRKATDGNPAEYKHLKAKAERDGIAFTPISSWDALPEAELHLVKQIATA